MPLPDDIVSTITTMAQDPQLNVAVYWDERLYLITYRTSTGVIEAKVRDGSPVRIRSRDAMKAFVAGLTGQIYFEAVETVVFHGLASRAPQELIITETLEKVVVNTFGESLVDLRVILPVEEFGGGAPDAIQRSLERVADFAWALFN